MTSLAGRIRTKIVRTRYAQCDEIIVQTSYLGSKILVRATEEVGQLIIAGVFETAELSLMLRQVRPGDVFLDIGANIGVFSLLVARSDPSISVHAFEPIPLNSCLLEASKHLNHLSNITVVRACVGQALGEVDFAVASDSAHSSIMDTGRKPLLCHIRVPVLTMDSYIADSHLRRVDVIKVDVEGAEKMVLSGARQLMSDAARRPRLLMLELCERNLAAFGSVKAEIMAMMSSWGYAGSVLEGERRVPLGEGRDPAADNVFFEQKS